MYMVIIKTVKKFFNKFPEISEKFRIYWYLSVTSCCCQLLRSATIAATACSSLRWIDRQMALRDFAV